MTLPEEEPSFASGGHGDDNGDAGNGRQLLCRNPELGHTKHPAHP